MQNLQIDYSDIPQNHTAAQSEDWEAPVHKYFGKKLPNGKTEREPAYTHVEYPRMMYTQRDGKISARMVHSDAEIQALGAGWEKTPAAFGYIGAPSFEQHIAMKDAKALESTTAEVADAPRRPGRPPKAE